MHFFPLQVEGIPYIRRLKLASINQLQYYQ
jgi:hypothetical protein